MSTLTLPPNAEALAAKNGQALPANQRLLLPSVPWQSYVTIADALPNRSSLRVTYDRGRLELMTISPEHERYKFWLGRLIETLAEVLGIAISPYGSMTFRREELERGLEPDQCFWIAHEKRVRTMRDWGPLTHPPPDLVIEIEISRSAINRMAMWAAFGVPEVWRFDGQTISVHSLQGDGNYRIVESSPSFPQVAIPGIVAFLQPSEETDYLSRVRDFRDWARTHIA